MDITKLLISLVGAAGDNLSAMKRFGAVKQLDSVDNQWAIGNWYVLSLSILLVVLLMLFIIVTIGRARKERKAIKVEVAYRGRQIGLTNRQLDMIKQIADKSEIANKESVFTIEEAFDKGAEKIIEESLSKGMVREEITQLKAELAGLREKIGFKHKDGEEAVEKSIQASHPSSREIPAGREVWLTRRTNPADGGIKTMIIENNDNEMKVKLDGNIKINFGDTWRVRYNWGVSVWEFESSVTGYDGKILKLGHSETIHFVSRRRFESVAVSEQAYMATFDFDKPLASESAGVPFFLPMSLTAVAGPWIRLETVHEIEKVGRVLVIIKIEKATPRPDSGFDALIIQDIGQIKYIEQKKDSCVVSVELTGMSDEDIDRLVGISQRVAVKEDRSGAIVEGKAENQQPVEAKIG